MKSNLHSKRLLQSLEDFVQKMQLLELADQPKLVAQTALKWTKGQPLLTKSLLDLLLKSNSKISRGQEAIRVEQIIRNRLIKDFKQDNLTLGIRKLLYSKDLVRLLTKSGGKIAANEQIYLQKLQAELGLSRQQGNLIQAQYWQMFNQANIEQTSNSQYFPEIEPENQPQLIDNSYQELILLLENSSIYGEVAAANSTNPLPQEKSTPSRRGGLKYWWLLLTIPLLFLLAKRFQPLNFDSTVATVAETNQSSVAAKADNLCDSNQISPQSSRLSLGEKLLTNDQKYNYLNPESKIALYAAIAAFSQCDYPLAQQKFEQALKISKNNPEARIYFNNTQAITQEHLKIAVSVPLDRKPEVAWEILRGVAQAQTTLNQQGGIKGKPLLIQIVNDEKDPELVRQLAQQLATESNILAVVGHSNSNTSLVAAEIYQKQGVVMISPTSSSAELKGIGSYIMRTTPSVGVLAQTLSSYALVSSFNKIAICTDSTDAASASFAAEFTADIADNGGEIVPVTCDFAQEDFNPVVVVETAIAQNADALLLATSGSKINQAVSLAQANQHHLPLLGSHKFYTHETIKTGQAAVADMVLTVPWLPEIDSAREFNHNASQLWGGKVNWRTAMSYDATQAIIQGLQQADTPQQLQAVLTNPDFAVDGSTGFFQFREGDRLGQVLLAYIGKSPQNSSGYRFLPLKISHNNK